MVSADSTKELIHVCGQVTKCEAQRPRDPVHVDKPQISLPALDIADVGAVNAGQPCQSFLRYAGGLAAPPHRPAEGQLHALSD